VWPPKEIQRFLEARGFGVRAVPAGKGLFTANTLLIATRRS
jgi:hypothetical protein